MGILQLARRILTARRRPDNNLLRAIQSLQGHKANATQLVGTTLTRYDTTDFRWPYPAGATRTGTFYYNQMMGVNLSDGYIDSFDDTKQLLCFAGLLGGNGQGVGRNPGYDIVAAGDGAAATIAQIQRPYRFTMPLATGSASRLTDIGKPVYAIDNQTVTMDPTATTYRNLVGIISNIATGVFPDTNLTALTGPYVEIIPEFDVWSLSQNGQRVQAALTTVNATTTLTNITNLVAMLLSGRKYMFHAKLFTTINAYGGIQLGLGGTATVTSMIAEGKVYNGTSIQSSGQVTALATGFAGFTGAADSAEVWGEITVNAAGTLTLQFTQNSSQAVNCSVKAGSYFEVYELLN
ncbi:MAG: hypothetical protein KGJ09_09200 [Candidatus Omnitrophica bacterium]|nr:hypothetical protein [Candidatus Omnitrophota bacterium]